jgi:hypothetical protein
MPKTKIDKDTANKIVDRFSRLQKIRQKSLEILIKVDKKTGEYKLNKLKKKLEELSK